MFQMSFAYSAMVRSVENLAMFATDRIDFFVHAVWSLYSSSADSIWKKITPGVHNPSVVEACVMGDSQRSKLRARGAA